MILLLHTIVYVHENIAYNYRACDAKVELKQISEISGYPFQIHYPDTGFEQFRIVANYFKQLLNIYC